jgi:hypothetical protein
MHEKNIMVQSQHPFILRLFNTYKDAHRLYVRRASLRFASLRFDSIRSISFVS